MPDADESRNGSATYQQIAQRSLVSVPAVIDTLKKFCTDGPDSALAQNRNPNSDAANLKATGDIQAKVIAKACTRLQKEESDGHLRFLKKRRQLF